MIKKFKEWDILNESSTFLEKAKQLCEVEILKETLLDAEDGIFSGVRIVRTESAKSYVAVHLDIDNLFSEVFITENPREALVAIIMKNTGRKTALSISRIIKDPAQGLLKYDVYAGNNKLSPKEIANKYNIGYSMSDGDAIPYYTSTPNVKQFHVY